MLPGEIKELFLFFGGSADTLRVYQERGSFVKKIEIYTDGACKGNPGPGGCACVLIYRQHRLELAYGYRETTNNRMEILAVIKALEALKETCSIDLYSDSRYVVEAVNQNWLENWQRNAWRKSDKSAVLNRDLWERLLQLLHKHQIRFHWVKGHAENPENDRCDKLASAAALDTAELQEDQGFSAGRKNSGNDLF